MKEVASSFLAKGRSGALTLTHFCVFVVSVMLIYYFRHNTVVSMLAPELIALYVALVNLNRKEILPPLFIIVLYKLVEFPISLAVFSRADVLICILISFDLALAWCLYKYHRADWIRGMFRVSQPVEKRYVPQVTATATLLLIGCLHYAIVLAEFLYTVHVSPPAAGEVPFFYRTFPEFRSHFKVILVLAIWSMMLDAIWVRKRMGRVAVITGSLFQQKRG